MDIELKVELREAINKWSNKVAEHDKREDVYFTDGLVAKMTDAAETVYDQMVETQKWMKEQGYIQD